MRFVDLENTDPEGLTHDEAPFTGAEVLFALWGWRWDHHRLIPDPSPAGEGMSLIAPEAQTPAALLIRRVQGNQSLAERARSLDTS